MRSTTHAWNILRAAVARRGDGILAALSLSLSCGLGTSCSDILNTSAYSTAAQACSLGKRFSSLESGAVKPLLPSPSTQVRHMASIQPEDTVYSGPQAPSPKRVTLRSIRSKYSKEEPISMVTAYDYPSAVHVDAAGIDILLVGDSVAMVVHGHDTTLPVTLDEMLLHCKAVSRGSRRPFLVGDLPFGSYETSAEQATRAAVRMMKEGLMDAVKLEGGGGARVVAAKAIVSTGVAVMGHVGLMPQSISVLGGFRPHGQTAREAVRVLREARDLQDAGCFAVVLECVPPVVAAALTRELSIPTIGIGAGPHCSGQVLVYHDLLGMMQHPHHAKVTPKFCKQYAAVGATIQEALQQYRAEVTERQFPGPKHSPYVIADREVEEMERMLRDEGFHAAADSIEEQVHGHRITPISE